MAPEDASTPPARPGPRRPRGSPSGPDGVRRAVLDAAADLFAQRGVAQVPLRDVAAAADVQLTLISRYVGNRAELVRAVFDDLTEQLAKDVLERPLEQMGFDRNTVMGRWTILLTYYAVARPDDLRAATVFNPIDALARVIIDNYGLDEAAARVRGAQIVASALGWRIFERYLMEAGGLAVDRQVLRDELTAMHRRLGATPWPSPPDPPSRRPSA